MTFKEHLDKLSVAASRNIKEKNFWLKQLAAAPQKCCFPHDRFVGQADRPAGDRVFHIYRFKWQGELFLELKKAAAESDIRLHMILTASLIALLQRYTAQTDIMVGTAIYKPELEGEFINTVLALRSQLAGEMSYKELLLQVRQTIVAANEHYAYPLELLLKHLHLPVSDRDFPLFDAAILLENIQERHHIRHLPLSMFFFFTRTDGCIEGILEYNSAVYGEAAIKRLVSHLTQLSAEALKDARRPLRDIEIFRPGERRQLLLEFNRTESDFHRDVPIYRLFEEQVQRTPDRQAIGFAGRFFTYREVNEEANRLARYLGNRGMGPGHIVGLMIDSSAEMITGILAILKAGAAYLPISPGYPQKRIAAMLDDSRASMLLTGEEIVQALSFTRLQGLGRERLRVFVTSERQQVEDLDSLQMPDRSLVDYEKYRPYIGQSIAKNHITVQFSRGCVYRCAYCFKIWPHKYVVRSAENMFEEIKFYYDLGVRRFAFVDDLPNIDMKNSSRLYESIIKNGLQAHLHFPNGIRGDILTPGYIDLMVAAGTVTMDLALETTSPRLQKLIRKNLNLERLYQNIDYIIRRHPQVILEMQIIHGLPGETEEEAQASLDYIKNLRWAHFPYIHVLNIYPGSAMAEIAVQHGISAQAIERSADIAYHELPETLPFSQGFSRRYQSEFVGEYFMCKERLLSVLPHQMRVLTEDELVQKYNSYLPVEIDSFDALLDYAGISREELAGEFLPDDYGVVPDLNVRLRRHFVKPAPEPGALRVLLLDLSQYFSQEPRIMYDVVEAPLGLMYVLTHLQRRFPGNIDGRIAKSRIDFDSYEQLKSLVVEFRPDIIGVRSLNFYKDFFHKTVSLIRQWGVTVPIIAGGPYATSNYAAMLQDPHIDLVVLGEGEVTFAQLIGRVLENGKKLPAEGVLKQIPGLAFIPSKSRISAQGHNRQVLLWEQMPGVLTSLPKTDLAVENGIFDPAYIIYTSGSTGVPKGVMVQHHNLVNQVLGLGQTFPVDSADPLNYILLAAFTFDVSVMHIFLSLTTGGRLFLIDEQTRKDPLMLWKFIHDQRIDILNIVPAFMKALLENMEPHKFHFKYLFVGGDAFDRELYRALQQTFTVDHLLNIYGPTETTINATLHECRAEDGEGDGILPIGRPLPNYRAYILDGDYRPVPIGAAGEICIAGAGVARGYLNNPELTADKFVSFNLAAKLREGTLGANSNIPLFQHSIIPKLYRTGDRGRWLPAGEIEFLGRLDQQVKIRGYRIEPAEIERKLVNHPGVKDAVVVAREDRGGDKFLSAFVVMESPLPDEESALSPLKEYLARELPDYMVPSYFKRIERLPLTVSGKVDERALPTQEIQTGSSYTAPRDRLERRLTGLWAEVIGMAEAEIGIDTNFFELGGHSLKATILISKIHKELNVKVPLVKLFKTPFIRGLAEYIRAADQGDYTAIGLSEKREFYVVSSAQRRLYILQQLEPASIAYNMPALMLLSGELERSRLEQTFRRLIRRHESLRTAFALVEGKPVQRIHDFVDFNIEYHQPGGSPKHVLRPFDLSRAPLLRVGLTPQEEDHIMVVDMHHIISDGISIALMIKDLMALYAGQDLAELKIQYKDFSEWQAGAGQSQSLREQESYWLKEFEGECPVLTLPLDYPRPIMQSFAGGRIPFELDAREVKDLKTLGLNREATLFMVLLALYYILLSKLSAQDDIVVGTPTAGRRHADVQPLIGMFVNTLPLRNYPVPEKSFEDFLAEVKQRLLSAFENQEYHFEDLVEGVAVNRDTGRNPIFDVLFTLDDIFNQDGGIPEIELGNLTVKPYPFESRTTKFDLTLAGGNRDDRMVFRLEYCTKLFKAESVERFSGFFKRITSAVLANPKVKIAEIELISPAEKQQLLYEFNHPRQGRTVLKTIQRLFAGQAERRPDQTALIVPGPDSAVFVSYGEVHRRSKRLAHLLRAEGVKPESIVALMADPSAEVVIAVLSILRAGGAFLPIAADYPIERVKYILADSGAVLTLAEERFKEIVEPAGKVRTLGGENLYQGEAADPGPLNSLRDLAYVMYTSGSTGKPKGVMIQHLSLANILSLLHRLYPVDETDNYLFKTSYVFDVSVSELFGWILGGGRLTVLEKEGRKDPRRISDIIDTLKVTHINFVPSMFDLFLEQFDSNSIKKLSSLKYIFLAGEELRPPLVQKYRALNLNIALENLYGPTEAAVYASGYSLSHWEGNGRIPIGRPLANVVLYVLDKHLHLRNKGINGELYIGGDGVARGYLNNPELTAERFVNLAAKIREDTRSPKHQPLTPKSHILYKTGDLARWRGDGSIDFLGRIDHQVKVRGFRVELREIEIQLLRHPRVQEVVVIDRENTDGERYLCAYVVSASIDKDGAPWPLNVSELREHLSTALPEYMMPSHFIFLAKMPFTAGGKIDRRSLPQPDESRPELALSYMEPKTGLEKAIAEVWQGVLGVDRVGIHDNFFELGGTSLKLMQVQQKLEAALDREIPIVMMFRYTTISSIAGHLTRQAEAGSPEITHRVEAVNRGKAKLKNLKAKKRPV
jgi:amino acid adenylation domain-containing protein